MTEKTTVIIPAYKPGKELLPTIEGLVDIGFRDIIVIDDGGGEAFAPVFDQVEANPYCTVLRHEVNRGKGAALKTAFAYFLENRPDSPGVVTADADGQHLPKDILAVAEKMEQNKSNVLGVRDFSDPKVPPRSKTGNRITCGMFRLFFGMKITDTQTGLRAFAREYLSAIATAEGDRYEFETNMLYLMDRQSFPIDEVKISTVYIDDNASSHFRVVRDSARIYAVQLKYLAGFILSAILFSLLSNFISFPLPTVIPSLILYLYPALVTALVCGLLHYGINALTVFDIKIRPISLVKSILVSVGIMLVLKLLPIVVFPLAKELQESIFTVLSSVCKVLSTLLVFFVNFRLQHKWVFRRSRI